MTDNSSSLTPHHHSHGGGSVVKFMPPNSCRVELSFFEKLYEMKLNEMKLAVDDFPISAFLRNNEMILTSDSFTSATAGLEDNNKGDNSDDKEKKMNQRLNVYSSGVLKNVNTTNEFISLDKPGLLTAVAAPLWDRICSGEVVTSPNCLLDFVFLSFADLKQYRFTYWLGFPAFVASLPYRHQSPPQLLHLQPDAESASNKNNSDGDGGHKEQEPEQQQDEYVEVANPGRSSSSSTLSSSSQALPACALRQVHAWSLSPESQAIFSLVRNASASEFCVCSLADAWQSREQGAEVIYCVKDVHGAFQEGGGTSADSSSSTYTPGWGVRNVLAFLAHSLSTRESVGGQPQPRGQGQGQEGEEEERVVNVLCVQHQRAPKNRRGELCFPLLTVVLPTNCLQAPAPLPDKPQEQGQQGRAAAMPRVVGWQANERGKPGPRVLDAAIVMDTRRIMEQAVDLNVRLMKWRLWPSLDTELLASTKCLLLGAGTLGCAVARTLMGWGVRDITLVDNGRVSYSNPARQSLFEFKDCEEKAFKSEAAARRLQAIFPGMRATGLVITIPMPGHRAASAKESAFLKAETHKLDELVQEHDVVFALTDSREARWLPTVQCAVHDKLLINAALGFDSYLVMRHGHGGPEVTHSTEAAGGRLGCYFCMDVIGPGNSQRDRTLDQQCTVTRPGLAQIASGLAVELMVALLHSPQRQRTPALLPASASAPSPHKEQEQEQEERDGGGDPLPHQIRGVLGAFSQVNPVCSSFQHCTACSPAILRKYNQHQPADVPTDSGRIDRPPPAPAAEGISSSSSFADFVEEVCNDPGGLLETISGVTGLIAGLDDLDLDLDMSSDEEVE